VTNGFPEAHVATATSLKKLEGLDPTRMLIEAIISSISELTHPLPRKELDVLWLRVIHTASSNSRLQL